MFKSKNNPQNDNKKEGAFKFTKRTVLNIVGIVLCVILLPILIMNCTLIIKGMIGDDREVPSIGKYIPLIVLTESMEDEIKAGDLIICETVDPQDIEIDDVISFFDPAGNGTSIVTHKVYKINYGADGKKESFETYGVNNFNLDGSIEYDKHAVLLDDVVGIYHGKRIPVIGHVAMFMQSTPGLIICIFVPIAAFVVYELLRRKKLDKVKDDDVAKLKAELEALKQGQTAQVVTEPCVEAQNDSNTAEDAVVDKDD